MELPSKQWSVEWFEHDSKKIVFVISHTQEKVWIRFGAMDEDVIMLDGRHVNVEFALQQQYMGLFIVKDLLNILSSAPHDVNGLRNLIKKLAYNGYNALGNIDSSIYYIQDRHINYRLQNHPKELTIKEGTVDW